ncbi:MAG TPA: 3'(2'),5'-bisphosphate nucleotidase [Candidatus Thioglobus sp.]|nr:3'(2'),5'-bisphosphate nucleotidase CysQ [Candidatus Thioglobus sp.]HIL20696.1 3'(2'),5'-bisphosphate nucleotidase [Candidatus Thioglobus sp.]
MKPMFAALLPQLIELTSQVGEGIMTLHREKLDITVKSDNTPLTLADETAHKLISEELERLTPGIPVLSEESQEIPFEIRKKWDEYWLIDPLDGTRDFLDGNYDFCINIAFIKNNYPVFGLIYAPFSKVHYYRLPGETSVKQLNNVCCSLQTSQPKRWQNVVIGHYSSTNKQLQKHLGDKSDFELFLLGSALKFCTIAEGKHHHYPKFGPCSEWDTAAGVCILEGAGGNVKDLDGKPLRYNTKKDSISPPFLASA